MSRRKGRTTVFRQNIPAVDIIPQADVQTIVDNAFSNMAGIVFAYAGTTPPSGWLLCNGQAVSRTVYADLFARIGTTHGDGDGVTTFNLPDYRGRFLRGVDGGAGRDPDRNSRTAMNTGGNTGDNVGSVQGQQIQSHSHTIGYTGNLFYNGGGGNPNTFWGSGSNQSTNAAGGSETRPVNAYVNYIIKT
jgi:microcystin-dependent protein